MLLLPARVLACMQEVRLFNCNDLINTDQGLWTLACICPRLRVLAVEGVNCRVPQASAAQLSQLTQVRAHRRRVWLCAAVWMELGL